MTQDQMNVLVPERLHKMEQKHNIKILFASEQGSRSWGLNDPGSDFDVRFVFIRDKLDYIQVFADHEVIRPPIDDVWDICGWDLARFLRFIYKSNPVAYECLKSPIYYLDTGFSEQVMPILHGYLSRDNMLSNYVKMTQNNKLERRKFISAKYYLYMMRPLLSAMWIKTKNTPPPIKFTEMCGLLPENLRPYVNFLIGLKVNAPEELEIDRIPELDTFLYGTLKDLSKYVNTLQECLKDWSALNKFFRGVIGL